MRTFHGFPATVSRSLFMLPLCSLCLLIGVPHALAEGPITHAGAPPVSFAAPFGSGQQGFSPPEAVSVNPHPPVDLDSMPPETVGDLMMVHQRYLAAIEAYQRAPRDSAVVWNKLGMAYQHMYALDIAKLQYEKALQLKPKYPEALNNLGTVYYGEHNYHKAEKYYKKAIKLKPNVATLYSNLGTAYFSDHDYKRGIKAYRKAFSIDPQVFIGNPLEKVAELGPRDEQIQLNYALARLYAQAGMFKQAIHCLRLAYIQGFDDSDKLMKDKDFAALRKTPQFRLFMTEEHIKDPNDMEQSLVIRQDSPHH